MEQSAVCKDVDPVDRAKFSAYGGFKKDNVSWTHNSLLLFIISHIVAVLQLYRFMFVKKASIKDVFHCPYRYKCDGYFALYVKTFQDRASFALAGTHTSTRQICQEWHPVIL